LPGKDGYKAVMKPVMLKKNKTWQCEKIIAGSAFHENIPETGLHSYLERFLNENKYKHIHIITVNNIIEYRISKKNKISVIKSANSAKKTKAADLDSKINNHDNVKDYLLKEGMPVMPLVDLGVFTEDFHIIKAKHYKFKQINNFLKNIISGMKDKKEENINDDLHIVEFGCGKSYLTFILYHYFKYIKNINVKITGYDKDQYVVDFCNNVANKYNYENLNFIEGDISKVTLYQGRVDMIVTLHACDTATDYALHYAIKNKVKYIFSVPCCQQEVNTKIKRADEYSLLLRYGLFKERFSALLTDCIRCEILNDCGYYVDAVEFIGEENTPKNAMIRARYTGGRKNYSENIRKLMSHFEIEHTLLKLLDGDKAE